MTDILAIVGFASDARKIDLVARLGNQGSAFSWILDPPIISKNLENKAAFRLNGKIVYDRAESTESRLYVNSGIHYTMIQLDTR